MTLYVHITVYRSIVAGKTNRCHVPVIERVKDVCRISIFVTYECTISMFVMSMYVT